MIYILLTLAINARKSTETNMRFLVQRVTRASVTAGGNLAGTIGGGLLVFIGVSASDTTPDADYLTAKLLHLRIFPDSAGLMNRSVTESCGSLLLVSQFTLYGDCTKGRRPSFSRAAPVDLARSLYDYTVIRIRQSGLPVETGIFQSAMQVELINDGPVTLMLESPHPVY